MAATSSPRAMADSPDWEARFRAPRTVWVEIAPDRPERGIACSNRSGVFQIERWEVETGTLEPITDDPSGRTWAALSPDGEWVAWHADRAGDELGHFVARRWDGGDVIDLTPDLPEYMSFAAGFALDGWFTASIVRDDLSQLLVLPPLDNLTAPRILDPGPGFVSEVSLASEPGDGHRAVAIGTTAGEGLALTLRVIDTVTGSVTRDVRQPPGAVRPLAFARDGRLIGSTTRSGATRPIAIDPSGQIREYDLPDVVGEIGSLGLSLDGGQAVVVASNRAIQTLHIVDLETGGSRQLPAVTGTFWLPFAPVGPRFDTDGTLVIVREDAGTMPEVVRVDPETGERLQTLLPAPEMTPTRPFRPVDIPSTEDATVQGWLGVPDGAGPFPTILELHGGPQAHETNRFHAPAQAWLDRGFAFLTLNYRGSTGFGRDYEQAIWGRVGELELADMVAARDWLVREGIARSDAIVLTGGSYGGYLTLLGLGRRPDLWAAGVALVAIADWRLMHEEGVGLREYQEALFGGTPEQTQELHAAASPISYVERLAAPLLVIQGRNDPRCPSGQMEVYVDAAQRHGKDLEIDWFDAGHGHGGIETRIAWQRRAMEFVERVLAERSGPTPP